MIPIKLASQLQIGQWVTLSSHKDLICIEDEKMLAAVREDFEIGGLMEGYWNTKLEALEEMRGWWKNNPEKLSEIDAMTDQCLYELPRTII